MDEWGSSVWDTPVDPLKSGPWLSGLPPPSIPVSEATLTESFNDLDFGEAAQPADDDDFGDDFGDFDDGGEQTMEFADGRIGGFREAEPVHEEFMLPSSVTWEPLRLDPLPPPPRLAEQVQELLHPIWSLSTLEELMTHEDIRQVEGLGQILVTPDSRTLYQTLFNVSPTAVTRPPNWTRSRIRRQHLISLGIPVNLDEVMPHVNGKPLPPLNISTRPSSAPPGPRTAPNPPSGSNTRAGTPRPGTPQPTGRRTQSPLGLGLGSKPNLDEAKITAMLSLQPDNLSLLPLPTLEAHLNTMRTLTGETSSLLTYLLQTREALQQNSETYNGLIAELVGEAQKMKTGAKTRTGAGKRGSGM
ncbi:hypothetical protein K439DRAFT_1656073 [Ramaria rubella]|nr:hypothetical protein K439DRAFT_1656073 [Ramaria rubella]